MASAVANCSDGPWAVARLPPARAMDPRRRLAINSAAFRIVRAGRGASPFGLYRTLPGDSRPVFNSRRAQQPLSSAAAPAPASALRPWFSVGFAGWTRCRDWRWRQQPCGLNGKTSRPPCGIEGNHHEGDRFRTLCRPGQSTGGDQDCDQNSHRPILPILRPHAVTSAAFSVHYPNAFSDFGVGDAAVGESNAIANGFDLLSPIAFAHVFQLDCWPRRYCFCFCIFVAQESEFHGVNRDE